MQRVLGFAAIIYGVIREKNGGWQKNMVDKMNIMGNRFFCMTEQFN